MVKEQQAYPSQTTTFSRSPPFARMVRQEMKTTEFNGISDQQIPYSLQKLKINLVQSGEDLMKSPPFLCPRDPFGKLLGSEIERQTGLLWGNLLTKELRRWGGNEETG